MEQRIPSAIDVSAILRSGVYLLRRQGRVAFVGKARCVLVAIINHRAALGSSSLSRLFPHQAIPFDAIEIIPCADGHRAAALVESLIAAHLPPHNKPPLPARPTTHAQLESCP